MQAQGTKKYIIAIDGGSQSSKVTIFDTEGRVHCSASEPLRPLYCPTPDVAEHPDDDWWTSIVSACKKAMALFTGRKEDIIGLGLCTIRCCRAALRADGKLASQALSWMDVRTSRPYDDPDPTVAKLVASTGYITYRFTGEFNDTVANYLDYQWPVDLATWELSKNPEDYKRLNIPASKLFNLQMPCTIAGHVTNEAAALTGVPAGIPVVNTSNDKAVEALGAGELPRGTALVSLGTYITSMVQGHECRTGVKNFFTNFASLPHEYLYESSGVRRGMWTISWLKNILGEEVTHKAEQLNLSAEEYLNKLAEQVPAGSDGLMTLLDWLAPADKLYKKGVLIGFDVRHTAAHIYRSIVEAIALTMRNNTYAMCDELGIKLENIIVSGGGANSALFMQIFSDVYGIPACRNEMTASVGMGAAIAVALATHVYPDYKTASAAMIRVHDRYKPISKNVELYTRLNEEVYKHIPQYTDEILKKSYPIFK